MSYMMAIVSKIETFFDLLGPLANTTTKRIVLLLLLAYISYRYLQKRFSKPNNSKSTPSIPLPSTTTSQCIYEEKEDIMPEEIPRRYIEPSHLKEISISEEMLKISHCGYTNCNGSYRWFLHDNKWCYFREHKDEHFALENNIEINILQNKNINFQWDKSIKYCWILSDLQKNNIYYAAPQLNNEYLPSLDEWIVINGKLPTPKIFVHLMDNTNDEKEIFENNNIVSISNNKIENVFKQIDINNIGVIDRNKVIQGFKILGHEIDNITILNIMPNDNDTFNQNQFCVEFKKYIDAMDSIDVEEDHDDNDNDNEDEDDDSTESISDLED